MPDPLDPPELESIAQTIAMWSGQPIEHARALALHAFALGAKLGQRVNVIIETERKLGRTAA